MNTIHRNTSERGKMRGKKNESQRPGEINVVYKNMNQVGRCLMVRRKVMTDSRRLKKKNEECGTPKKGMGYQVQE